MHFSSNLLAWYGRNARPLPWRNTRDAYKVWVSEIILQQTRIDQGLSYYERFIRRFPDVCSLAAASEEEVLRLWQGLGYYSRARFMHQAANAIVNRHGGLFPHNYAGLLKIKGIGPYTAAAVASIVYGEAVPVLDGNALRVYARYLGVYQPVNSTAGLNAIREAAQRLISDSRPGDFNQAVMDLGATVCMPRVALCNACPLAGGCFANRRGEVKALPVKSKKPGPADRYIVCFVIRGKDGRICLRRRDNAGIWRGLYDFPTLIYDEPKTADEILSDPQVIGTISNKRSLTYTGYAGEVIHLLTHLRLHLYFFEFETDGPGGLFLGQPVNLYTLAEVSALPLPRPVEQYLREKAPKPGIA